MILRVLELKKLDRASEEEKRSDIYKWAMMISAREWEVLKRMENQNEFMKEAVSEMEKINLDKEKRYLYLQREKRLRDESGVREYARKEGKEEGIKEDVIKGRREGIEEGHDQVFRILQFLQSGYTPEQIAEETGCSAEFINRLSKFQP